MSTYSQDSKPVFIRYRQARVDESEVIATLIYEAASRMTSYSLDADRDESIDFIRFCFERNLGFYGLQWQHVAESDEGLAMTLTMYSGAQYTSLVRQFIKALYQYFGLIRATRLLIRSKDLMGLYVEPGRHSLFLANACVPKNMRGRGIFSRFFSDYVLNVADIQKTEAIELDVGMDNPNAEKLYRRLGFQTVKENPYKGKGDIKGVKRLRLPLTVKPLRQALDCQLSKGSL